MEMQTHGVIACMYITNYNIIVMLKHIYNNFKIFVTCNYSATPKKIKHGLLWMYVQCV